MEKSEILLVAPIYEATLAELSSAFVVHKLWEAADQSLWLDRVGPGIAGMVTTGGKGADATLMDKLPRLEIIACFGVGYDAIDVAHARKRDIRITNTPDVLTDDVADLAIGLVIDAARRITASDRFVRAGEWLEGPMRLGKALRGSRIGIVGVGRIGMAVAKRAEAFGMEIAYNGPRRKPELPYEFHSDLAAIARWSDFLVLTLRAVSETYRIVDAGILDDLGPKGVLVNVARGSVVDQDALGVALRDGRIGGAALDVFDDEPHVPANWLDFDNVILQPHHGSATHQTRHAMGRLVVDNLTAHFERRRLPSEVI